MHCVKGKIQHGVVIGEKSIDPLRFVLHDGIHVFFPKLDSKHTFTCIGLKGLP